MARTVAILGLLALAAGEAAAESVDLELVLLADASRSIDDGGRSGGLAREIEHRTPAEEDFIFFQLFQVLFDFGHGQTGDLRHLRGRKAAAFE